VQIIGGSELALRWHFALVNCEAAIRPELNASGLEIEAFSLSLIDGTLEPLAKRLAWECGCHNSRLVGGTGDDRASVLRVGTFSRVGLTCVCRDGRHLWRPNGSKKLAREPGVG
jgi:hypothetical protein